MAISLNNHETRIKTLEGKGSGTLKVRKVTGNKLPSDFTSGIVQVFTNDVDYTTCGYICTKGQSWSSYFGVNHSGWLTITYDGNLTLTSDVGLRYMLVLTIYYIVRYNIYKLVRFLSHLNTKFGGERR